MTVKSKKARTQSNIDMSDLNKAIQMKQDDGGAQLQNGVEDNVASADAAVESVATQQVILFPSTIFDVPGWTNYLYW